ncbi:Prophage integrase IntS [Sphingomonas sp. S2M10]|uniref:tyrosine-type recombinase/integrase n=1 Tax=Sphingomonas sp. S2M10 TaxID=2705010 RepID=UPI0014564CAD|nr:integrase arm-type DNA-binding domain-containing protein [Sphingomonas sp. S2M10]NLS28140.1 Prophage integrase IntS [Sphingomonas sp. S2M10]
MLTNAAVKAAGARSRAYKMADERGLYLFVAPTGLKSWRMKFRLQGREKLLTIGSWPEVTLADARAQCDQAREQLRRGDDPCVARRRAAHSADDAAWTFEVAARAWHSHQCPGWTEAHATDVLTSMERDVFATIGHMALGTITPPAILQVLRAIEDRGAGETARRVRQRISAVFGFAISIGEASADPAAIVKRALRPQAHGGRQAAILELVEIRALLGAAEDVKAAPIVKLASRFLALTAVRLGALRGATWSEFEGIDWAGTLTGPTLPLWRVPAARMKLSAAKKRDRAFDHLVPLSVEAVDVLRQARAIAGAGALVFPGRSGSAAIGESAIGDLYDRAGYAGRHVPHGWRASFATVMNERRPLERAAIDLALGHAPKDKVEAAYNRSAQMRRRRALFQEWAALISV